MDIRYLSWSSIVYLWYSKRFIEVNKAQRLLFHSMDCSTMLRRMKICSGVPFPVLNQARSSRNILSISFAILLMML